MDSITKDFRHNSDRARGYKRLILPLGIFLLVAGTVAAGFYLYENDSNKSLVADNDSSCSLPKDWLIQYFATDDCESAGVGGAHGDPDGDVLTNTQEFYFGTDPLNPDTDGDGDIDGYEIAFGKNPKGGGNLALTPQTQDYIDEIIRNNEEYSEFSLEKIKKEVDKFFQPGQHPVTVEFPEDSEIIISNQNDIAAFEKYYYETASLYSAEDSELDRLNFETLTPEEINDYIGKLRATEKILLEKSVPSEITNIHKLKIAGLRTGIKLFELFRDRYSPDSVDPEFWGEVFHYSAASQSIGELELTAWQELGIKFQDIGGW